MIQQRPLPSRRQRAARGWDRCWAWLGGLSLLGLIVLGTLALLGYAVFLAVGQGR